MSLSLCGSLDIRSLQLPLLSFCGRLGVRSLQLPLLSLCGRLGVSAFGLCILRLPSLPHVMFEPPEELGTFKFRQIMPVFITIVKYNEVLHNKGGRRRVRLFDFAHFNFEPSHRSIVKAHFEPLFALLSVFDLDLKLNRDSTSQDLLLVRWTRHVRRYNRVAVRASAFFFPLRLDL
jgi:hypothetical protein